MPSADKNSKQKPDFSSQRTRKWEAQQDIILLDNNLSTPANIIEKKYSHSTSKGQVGCIDFYPDQDIKRYPNTSYQGVIREGLVGTQDFQYHRVVFGHPQPGISEKDVGMLEFHSPGNNRMSLPLPLPVQVISEMA